MCAAFSLQSEFAHAAEPETNALNRQVISPDHPDIQAGCPEMKTVKTVRIPIDYDPELFANRFQFSGMMTSRDVVIGETTYEANKDIEALVKVFNASEKGDSVYVELDSIGGYLEDLRKLTYARLFSDADTAGFCKKEASSAASVLLSLFHKSYVYPSCKVVFHSTSGGEGLKYDETYFLEAGDTESAEDFEIDNTYLKGMYEARGVSEQCASALVRDRFDVEFEGLEDAERLLKIGFADAVLLDDGKTMLVREDDLRARTHLSSPERIPE